MTLLVVASMALLVVAAGIVVAARPRGQRSALVAIAVVLAILGTTSLAAAADPYPFAGPGTEGVPPVVRIPRLPGQTSTHHGLAQLVTRNGDRITLIDAEPLGSLQGADVQIFVELPDERTTAMGTAGLLPVGGTVLDATSPSGGLVIQVTPRQAGRFELTGLRVRFRVGGWPEQTKQVAIPGVLVCAADPLPPTCE